MFSCSLSVSCFILCLGLAVATPLVAVFLCLHSASFSLGPLASCFLLCQNPTV